jgi:hypothetical protein
VVERKQAKLENQMVVTMQGIREEETNFNDLKNYAQPNSCGKLKMEPLQLLKIYHCGSTE